MPNALPARQHRVTARNVSFATFTYPSGRVFLCSPDHRQARLHRANAVEYDKRTEEVYYISPR